VVGGGGADLKLQFRLKRGGDRTKRCQKIKRSIELVLASWEESVTRRNGMATSVEGEAALRREKRGDDVSWADVNLNGLKNKENACGRFSCYKWTMKI
jgi:hypothetical protein